MSLKPQAIKAVRWTAITAVGILLFRIIQLIVLGRVLSPDDFGLMAMVMALVYFADVFADMGLSAAVIQRKDPTREELSTLYWINLLTGFLLFVLFWGTASFFARWLEEPELNRLIPVMSFSFVISAIGAQFMALLRKELRFDLITYVRIPALCFGTVVAIWMAFRGYGVWALVGGSLSSAGLQSLVVLVMGFRLGYRPAWYFRFKKVTGYLSFGIYRVGAMAINSFNSRLDQLLIGSFLGANPLGFYNLAFRLTQEVTQQINPILTNVAFPLFAKVQDQPKKLKSGYLQMIELLTSVNAPLLIGLAAIAPVMVPLLVGEKWMPAVPIIEVMAIYTLIRSYGNAGGSLILAKGKANWTLYWNLGLLFVIPPAVWIGAREGGAIGVAFALMLVQLIMFFLQYLFLIRTLIRPCFLEYMATVMRPVLLAVVMGGLVRLVLVLAQNVNPYIQCSLALMVGAISYMILVLLFHRAFVRHIFELLGRSRGNK